MRKSNFPAISVIGIVFLIIVTDSSAEPIRECSWYEIQNYDDHGTGIIHHNDNTSCYIPRRKKGTASESVSVNAPPSNALTSERPEPGIRSNAEMKTDQPEGESRDYEPQDTQGEDYVGFKKVTPNGDESKTPEKDTKAGKKEKNDDGS